MLPPLIKGVIMIVKIIDIHDNHIDMSGIESIRETVDNMIVVRPIAGTVAIHINGVVILQSDRPTFDKRLIKSIGVATCEE